MADLLTPTPDLPDWAASAINLASHRLKTEAARCSDDSFAAMDRRLQEGGISRLRIWGRRT